MHSHLEDGQTQSRRLVIQPRHKDRFVLRQALAMHLLLLAGEAGLGKSRLLGAIKRAASAEGFTVVQGGTYPSDLQVAGAILLDLARAMRRTPGLEDVGARLEARLEAGAAGVGDAHRRRRLLVLDVAEILIGTATDADPGLPLDGDGSVARFSSTVFLNAARWILERRPRPPLFTLTSPEQPEPSGTRIAIHPNEGNTGRTPRSLGTFDTHTPRGHDTERRLPLWPWLVGVAALVFLTERSLALMRGAA